MKLLTTSAALFVLVALSVPAAALDCTTARPEVDVAGNFYLDVDMPCFDDVWSFWIYQESNGIPGLQRHDECRDDTDELRCYPSDTVVF